MTTSTGAGAPAGEDRAQASAVTPARTVPIKVWAVAGGLILTFIAYVLIRWATGPYFERVDPGPTDLPLAMKVNLIFWQVVSIPGALIIIYRFVVRPWRRHRSLGVDGILVLAFGSLWFQDPLAAMGQAWFTYNSYSVNAGSWLNAVPGALTAGEPGRTLVEPLLIIPALYVYFFLLGVAVGCWIMRAWRRRRPAAGAIELVAVAFLGLTLFDLVFEGLIWMPGGIWEYPGGHGALLFPDSYHKFPVQEMITASATFTSVAALRFFRNDRGETLAERGADELAVTPGRLVAVRALAMTAAVHLCFFVFYTAPNTWLGLHSTTWPEDLQERSYFTNMCGQGTGKACPGPAVPIERNDNDSTPDGGSAYVGDDGALVVPPDTHMPKIVEHEVDEGH